MYYIIGFIIMCGCIVLGLICIIAAVDQAIANGKVNKKGKKK